MCLAVRLVVLTWLCAASASPAAAPQADGTTTLVDRLQSALTSGDIDAFVAESAPWLSASGRSVLVELAGSHGHHFVLSERSRSVQGVEVEVLRRRGDRAVLAVWFLTTAVGPSGRETLTSVVETSRIDELVRLEPDMSRPLTVRNLVIEGPDFTLTLPAGTAVASLVDGQYTALALGGRSTIRFTPQDPVEQQQLRIFGGRPQLEVVVDEAFVRLNSSDAGSMIRGSLAPATDLRPRAIEQLRSVYEARATLGYRLELRHLSDAIWSLEPRPGSLLVDFRTRRDGWLTYLRAPASDHDISLFDREGRRQISLYSSAPDRPVTVTLGPPYRIEHTDLDIVLEPDRRWLRGRATLRLRVDGPARALALRLDDALRVVSVSSRRAGPLSTLRSAGDGGLVIGWPLALQASSVEEIDIQFQGFLSSQRLDDDAPAARRMAGAQDALGVEPRFLYSSATSWYPQAAGAQFSTARLRVTVPAPYEVVATGDRRADVTSPYDEPPGVPSGREGHTVTFAADQPIRYLALLVARMVPTSAEPAAPPEAPTSAAVFEGGIAGVRLRPTAERVQDILAFYTRLLGGAPFSSLTVAALGDQLPSGHSPAYFVLLNQPVPTTPYTWDRDPVAFDDEPDFFLAHEVAHQWWGQTVTGRDYGDRWITEGFAQYLAWMYVTSARGEETGDRLMRRMRETAESFDDEGPIRLGFRVGHLRGDRRAFRAIVYNKSAVVLHMLRRIVGDDAFAGGLRELMSAHRFSVITTGDVERAFATRTDVPLARFFTRWVHDAGLPHLRMTWSATATSLSVLVEQVGQVFDVPYDLSIELADGRRQLVSLVVTEARQQFKIPLEGSVRRVRAEDRHTPARVDLRASP